MDTSISSRAVEGHQLRHRLTLVFQFQYPNSKPRSKTNQSSVSGCRKGRMQIGRDGILGSPYSEQRKPSLLFNRQWLKRRETWLVVLGVLLHLVYMLSIFDIYFKTPIVHGMDPVPPRISPPAKRLVLLVGANDTISLSYSRSLLFFTISQQLQRAHRLFVDMPQRTPALILFRLLVNILRIVNFDVFFDRWVVFA